MIGNIGDIGDIGKVALLMQREFIWEKYTSEFEKPIRVEFYLPPGQGGVLPLPGTNEAE